MGAVPPLIFAPPRRTAAEAARDRFHHASERATGGLDLTRRAPSVATSHDDLDHALGLHPLCGGGLLGGDE